MPIGAAPGRNQSTSSESSARAGRDREAARKGNSSAALAITRM